MEQIKRFKIPAAIGAGALVVVGILFMGLIKPQSAKLSGLHDRQTQLQAQQAQLEARIATLKHDKARMAANCAALEKALAEIPGTPDVAAFLQQVTALAVASGDPNTPTISVLQASKGQSVGGATPVQVSLTLNGNYGQMTSFMKGLDSFPRLFTVTNISVTGGVIASSGGAVNPGTSGYVLSMTGAVYYATGRKDACAPTSA
ncbi:MAG: type 4a pilus biogenesis protein PilO [Acidobacteriota bacterium]|nr:type 4a pilus biogenesis protein PilO [Acidobacteriota bacterium]